MGRKFNSFLEIFSDNFCLVWRNIDMVQRHISNSSFLFFFIMVNSFMRNTSYILQSSCCNMRVTSYTFFDLGWFLASLLREDVQNEACHQHSLNLAIHRLIVTIDSASSPSALSNSS